MRIICIDYFGFYRCLGRAVVVVVVVTGAGVVVVVVVVVKNRRADVVRYMFGLSFTSILFLIEL